MVLFFAIRTFIPSVFRQLLNRRILPLRWVVDQGIVPVSDLLFEQFVLLDVLIGVSKQGFGLCLDGGLVTQLLAN